MRGSLPNAPSSHMPAMTGTKSDAYSWCIIQRPEKIAVSRPVMFTAGYAAMTPHAMV